MRAAAQDHVATCFTTSKSIDLPVVCNEKQANGVVEKKSEDRHMSKDHQKATHSVDSVTVAHDAYSSYVAAAGVSAGEEHDPIQTAVRNSIDLFYY